MAITQTKCDFLMGRDKWFDDGAAPVKPVSTPSQWITDYLKWIKDNTVVKTVEEGKVRSISTPFLDRHNDHLDIYVVKNNGSVRLTDKGNALADLRMSGFDHNIDFLIPASKSKPKRLVKAINNVKKGNILSSIMAFSDINQVRETATQNFVIYNDVEKEVSNDVIGALDNYGILSVPWSEKEQWMGEFMLN